MKKSVEERKTDHVDFTMKIEHPKGSDVARTRTNHSQQPLTDIIAKFQKIKEEKFKPKAKNYFQNSKTPEIHSRTNSVLFDRHSRPQKLKSLPVQRPQSASSETQGDDHGDNAGIGERRMSLPSIFNPLTPLPVKMESLENMEREDEAVKIYHTRRRHSVSHVMTEYSKHNLQHLTKLHEKKIKELNDVVEPEKGKNKPKPKTKTEDDTPKWLTGNDIHAFYNMWDKPRNLGLKKRLHIRKVLPREDEDKDDDQYRPRVFSF